MTAGLDARQAALLDLGQALRGAGYGFVSPTPETQRRVNGRPENREARTVRDVFGWSRPFHPSCLPAPLFELGRRAEVLVRATEDRDGDRWRSLVRFSTLPQPARAGDDLLFVHSAFPTDGPDSVFFGPDSYRFAAFLLDQVKSARRLVDVGCGTGIGGLVLAGRAQEVVLGDVNPQALRFAQVNAALAGFSPTQGPALSIIQSDVLRGVQGDIDVVVANPPYIVDDDHRLYRDGGGELGLELAIRIAEEALDRLVSGGRLALYTGTPIVDGRNVLADRLQPTLRQQAATWQWRELDPDVFGEELERPAYRRAERLAVVGLVATAR